MVVNVQYRNPLIASLAIHIALFLIGAVLFVKTAKYSVQSIPESIQVDLVQPQEKFEPKILSKAVPLPPKLEEYVVPKTKPLPQKVVVKPKLQVSQVIRSIAKVTQASPDYLQNPPPEYPLLAKEMRQEGLVILAVHVNREGQPMDVEIIKSSGFRLLDAAALKAVYHWKFQPGRIGDISIESRVTIPIKFLLEK